MFNCDILEAKDRLKKIRDDQLRRSEEVVELWDEVLSDFSYKLGSEGNHLFIILASSARLILVYESDVFLLFHLLKIFFL